MTKRHLGYGYTNAQGIAKLEYDPSGSALSHSYTGTGAGKVNIFAEVGTTNPVRSEDYIITDCLKYDKGLSGSGNYNDIWTTSSSTWLTRGDDGTTVSYTSTSQATNNLSGGVVSLDSDYVVEMDLVGGNFARFRATMSGGTADYCNGTFENMTGHIRVEITPSSVVYYLNDNVVDSHTSLHDGHTGFQFGIRCNANDVLNFKYRNFELYPV